MKTVSELIARIDGLLPKWRAWFPNEESMVDVPRCELLALVEEARATTKLREAIRDAGFAVMETSGKWSLHDVSEKGKAEDARSLEVATENVHLSVRVERLEQMLDKWLEEPRVCLAVAKDCTNEDECGCLYCRTDNLIRKG